MAAGVSLPGFCCHSVYSWCLPGWSISRRCGAGPSTTIHRHRPNSIRGPPGTSYLSESGHATKTVRTLRELAEAHQLGSVAGAWVASEPDQGDYHRRDGFRRGARLLLQHAATSRATHSLIYPALTVYRHYYELQLKELVRVAYDVLGEPRTKTLKHGLVDLLAEVRRGMAVIWPDESDLQPVLDAVSFLHAADPSAQVFRYATLRSGDPSVGEASFLDPLCVLDFLDAGADLLEGAETGMDEWLKDRAEFLSDMAELDAQNREYNDYNSHAQDRF